MKSLKEIFASESIESVDGFRFGYRKTPFKSIQISPKVCDPNNLLCFTLQESYLCGMTYTSFASGYLYSYRFDENSSMDDVIEWIRNIYDGLEKSINSTRI